MKFTAAIRIMPLKEILDPQGKVVTNSMKNLGLQEIQHVRVGKHITLEIEAHNKMIAQEKVNQACHIFRKTKSAKKYPSNLKKILQNHYEKRGPNKPL